MNSKWIVALVIVLAVVAGGYYYMRKGSSYNPVMQNAPQALPSPESQKTTNTTETTPVASGNAVEIKDFKFSPATLTVKVGDKVTWTNQDTVGHTATADDNSFDTGILTKGQSGSITFSKAGTYTYHCSPHPFMKATIVVE